MNRKFIKILTWRLCRNPGVNLKVYRTEFKKHVFPKLHREAIVVLWQLLFELEDLPVALLALPSNRPVSEILWWLWPFIIVLFSSVAFASALNFLLLLSFNDVEDEAFTIEEKLFCSSTSTATLMASSFAVLLRFFFRPKDSRFIPRNRWSKVGSTRIFVLVELESLTNVGSVGAITMTKISTTKSFHQYHQLQLFNSQWGTTTDANHHRTICHFSFPKIMATEKTRSRLRRANFIQRRRCSRSAQCSWRFNSKSQIPWRRAELIRIRVVAYYVITFGKYCRRISTWQTKKYY